MKSARRKRLCVLMPRHWSQVMGGSQYQAKCLIEEVQKIDQYDIYYLTRGSNPNYTSNGYTLIQYGYPGSQIHGSHRHLFEILLLPKILNKIAPDIIYQRVGCAQTGIAARYAAKHGCKMVWHIASEYDIEPTSISISRLLVYRLLERRLLNFGIKHAAAIIAQTMDQKKMLERNYRRRASAVIPNFHPRPVEVISKKRPIKVAWVANLKDLKQPEVFIRLASAFGDATDAQFIMIGAIQGEEHQKEKYRDLMNQAPRLTYLGPKSQKEVNEILSRSHIFVNTSLREGFPNTFIQAWLRKVPVVSLSVNPDRLIERHGLGLVSGSFEQLKKDVSLLVENQDLRDRLGENARNFANQYFSMQNVNQVLRIFDSLL